VYAGLIVITLSVGLGVNAGVLTFAHGVLVETVPFREAERLVLFNEDNPGQNVEDMVSSMPMFRDWKSLTTTFETMGASSSPLTVVLQADGRHQRLRATLVTPSLFEVTGVQAAAGRLFDEGDDQRPGAHPVALISEEFWRSRFNGDRAALGSVMTLDNSAYTIVGVIPARYPDIADPDGRTDVWLPMMMAPVIMGRSVFDERALRAFRVVARVRDGVMVETAREELAGVGERLAEVYPGTQEGWVSDLIPIREALLGQLRAPAVALLAGAGLLLLISVTNAGFLLLLRTAERETEFALRLALGASRGELLRRLTEENIVVVAISSAVALLLAAEVVSAFSASLPPGVPAFVEAGVGLPSVLATVSISVGILGVLCALPLLQSRRLSLTGALKSGGRRGRAHTVSGLERGLIVSQVATASVLAFGSILLLRSLGALHAEDVGFSADRLLTARVDATAEARPIEELVPTARELRLAAEQTPGVQAAYLWSPHVPGEAVWMSRFYIEDRPELADHEIPGGRIHGVTPGAVTGIGMTLVEGRDIETEDLVSGRRVALVSETVARDMWPGTSAVGKRIRKWNWEDWVTIVGVVEDARHAGRLGVDSEIARDFYFLMDQAPELGRDLVVLAKTAGGPEAVVGPLRDALQQAVPDLPVYDLRAMRTRLREHESVPRLTAFLSAAYAIVALVLAGLGLYTILAYAAERRRHEIGLKMALGAPSGLIARELTGAGLRTGLLGVVIGLSISLAAATALRSILYEVSPIDWPTILGATVLLVALAFGASGIPAARAMKWSPAILLRGE
jgi:putative ABC transport system permease protein